MTLPLPWGSKVVALTGIDPESFDLYGRLQRGCVTAIDVAVVVVVIVVVVAVVCVVVAVVVAARVRVLGINSCKFRFRRNRKLQLSIPPESKVVGVVVMVVGVGVFMGGPCHTMDVRSPRSEANCHYLWPEADGPKPTACPLLLARSRWPEAACPNRRGSLHAIQGLEHARVQVRMLEAIRA